MSDFVSRLSKAVSCYYHQTPKAKIYCHNTTQRGSMGVFRWVSERKTKFIIESYKDLADRAGVTHLADKKHNLGVFQKGVDGIFFFVGRGSHDEDYKKAITALKAILNMKN